MADVVNSVNTINNPPKSLNVGVLTVPERMPKADIYNDVEARKKFKVLSSDVFQEKEKVQEKSKVVDAAQPQKKPKCVSIWCKAAIAAAVAFIGVKTGCFLKIKNVLMQAVNRR